MHLHSFRWTFTNWLRQARMDYSILKQLRGDSGKSMIEYNSRINEEEMRKEYLKKMPKVGFDLF